MEVARLYTEARVPLNSANWPRTDKKQRFTQRENKAHLAYTYIEGSAGRIISVYIYISLLTAPTLANPSISAVCLAVGRVLCRRNNITKVGCIRYALCLHVCNVQ